MAPASVHPKATVQRRWLSSNGAICWSAALLRHPLHSSMSCPECGSEHIADVEMRRPSSGALTAVSLNRLREKAEDLKVPPERTNDGDEAASHLTRAEQEGISQGTLRRWCSRPQPPAAWKPRAGRPRHLETHLAGVPVMLPLETDMQLTGLVTASRQSLSAAT